MWISSHLRYFSCVQHLQTIALHFQTIACLSFAGATPWAFEANYDWLPVRSETALLRSVSHCSKTTGIDEHYKRKRSIIENPQFCVLFMIDLLSVCIVFRVKASPLTPKSIQGNIREKGRSYVRRCNCQTHLQTIAFQGVAKCNPL